ncbi:hypothetical protein GCM10025771_26670 [Niveibacterium umoris]|uniref:Diguanylate cyclase (GGDEF)-like protein n=1 Tax=Niveibacterium umoris TaxID=1193620 RepID=A0A840BII4_9RHOO|nr:EAL domain-containing protein [Niveibacterium umoris]MBB4012144.1 diguanylate cyclase (GGDEF)-like protein [Niveibacterium umoris]
MDTGFASTAERDAALAALNALTARIEYEPRTVVELANALYAEADEALIRGAALVQRGAAQRILGQHGEALASLQAALYELADTDDLDWQGEAHLQLVALYGLGQSFELAEHHQALAQAAFKRSGNPHGILRARVFSAISLGIADRDEEALALLSDTCSEYARLTEPDPVGHAMCLANLAAALTYLGRPEQAQQCLDEALPLALSAKSLRAEAMICTRAANLAKQRSDVGTARALATRANDIATRVGFVQLIALATQVLAEIAEADGDMKLAVSLTDNALQAAVSAGDRSCAIGVLREAALRAERMGDVVRALADWKAHFDERLKFLDERYRSSVHFQQTEHTIALARKHGAELESEVRHQTEAMEATLAKLRAEADRRRQAEAELRQLADYDPLTACASWHRFPSIVNEVVNTSPQGAAILLVDLRGLKAINDEWGHLVGDQLVREAAARLRSSVAPDAVVRLGGDEFVVVLAGTLRALTAGEIAARVVERISAPFSINGEMLQISTSIGVARYPDHGCDAESLLQSADLALSAAKLDHRRQVVFYDAIYGQRLKRSNQMRRLLRTALARREFTLCYQPQIRLSDRVLIGFEALIGWQSPELGAVSPAEFIPLAETGGEILSLGRWVFESAFAQAKVWTTQTGRPLRMSVNLSMRQFRDPLLGKQIREALDASGLAPDQVELEVTESCAMEDPEQTLETLGALRDLGVRVALDDFGTGYSNIAQLVRMPISSLKLDRSLINGVGRESRRNTIVLTVIRVAHTLNIETVAEGIEDEATLDAVKALGATHGQGYHFGQALAPDDPTLLRWIAQA